MILSAILSTLCGTSRGPALASLCYSNGRRLPAGCFCTPAAPLVLMSKRLIATSISYLLAKLSENRFCSPKGVVAGRTRTNHE